MILDFISRNNNLSYSVKFAKLLGVYSSIYMSLLLDIHLLNFSEEYVKLTRDDIYNMTGIEEDIQIKAEDNLKSYNLIEITPVKNSSNKNYYKLNMELVIKLINLENSEIDKELKINNNLFKSMTKPPKNVSKRAAIINNLKEQIPIKDKIAKTYIENWIDNVMQKTGYLSKDGMIELVNVLKEYSKNVEEMRELFKLSAILAYKDPKYVINKYEQNKQEEILKSSKDSHQVLGLNNEKQDAIDENISKLRNYEGETF